MKLFARISEFVRAYWRGNIGPLTCLLIFVIALGMAYIFVIGRLLSVPWITERYLLQLVLLAISLALSIPLAVWQFVGAWRSFRRAGGDHRVSRKVFAAGGCGAVVVLAVYVIQQRVPEFGEIYAEFRKLAEASSKYKIAVGSGSDKVAVYTGEIVWGSAKALEEYLSSRPQVLILEIDSTGGGLQEAVRMANLVKTRKLITFVQGQCLSACTIVYVAGNQRLAVPKAKFGFHRVSASMSLADPAALERYNAQYSELLLNNGVDKRFVDQVMKISQPQIWIPGNSDLKIGGFVQHFIE